MATFNKINDWIEHLVEGANLGTDTFRIALSSTAPGAETPDPTADGNGVLANVTEIAYTNYSDDMGTDRQLENVTSAQTGGTNTFDADNITVTASGGALPAFRYIYVYDDTLVNDPLVCYWDNGSDISLNENDSVVLQFDAAGLFTVA